MRDPGEGRAVHDKTLAAALAAVAVMTAFTVYWVVQMQGVREMLALAYG